MEWGVSNPGLGDVQSESLKGRLVGGEICPSSAPPALQVRPDCTSSDHPQEPHMGTGHFSHLEKPHFLGTRR